MLLGAEHMHHTMKYVFKKDINPFEIIVSSRWSLKSFFIFA